MLAMVDKRPRSVFKLSMRIPPTVDADRATWALKTALEQEPPYSARVTFEVLLASFDLEKDAALTRLGSLVHYLDVGGIPVAEAPGLEMILNGARRQFEDDNKLLKEAAKAFDLLYASYTDEK